MQGKIQVPDGWRVARLGDVARFVNGRAFRPEGWGTCGLPIVRIQNLTSPNAPYNFFNGEVANDNLIDSGDIVISWSASLETRTWQKGLAVLNQHIFKVIGNPSVAGRRFLYHLLQLTMFSLRQQVHGTTMQHITKGNFDSTCILLPPLPEQCAIAAVLDAISDAVERADAVIAATERLRDALLHDLLTRGVPGWRMMDLAEAPLEIIDGDRGKSYPKQHDLLESGHCLFLNTGNVTTNGFDFSSGAFISPNRDQQLRKGKLDRDDVVLTTRGTIGNSAHFDGTVPYEHIRINSGMVILRASKLDLHPRYLYALVRSQMFLSQVRTLRIGSAQPQLPIRIMERITIPVPPLPEQRGIAAMLDSVDDAAKWAREERNGLQSLKASVSDALLSGRVRVSEVL